MEYIADLLISICGKIYDFIGVSPCQVCGKTLFGNGHPFMMGKIYGLWEYISSTPSTHWKCCPCPRCGTPVDKPCCIRIHVVSLPMKPYGEYQEDLRYIFIVPWSCPCLETLSEEDIRKGIVNEIVNYVCLVFYGDEETRDFLRFSAPYIDRPTILKKIREKEKYCRPDQREAFDYFMKTFDEVVVGGRGIKKADLSNFTNL
uniref:Uncharacterized protein n=1 Tax=Marseillevirus LCMAC101 TaxID=2506602 RepID=A0A481YTE2_9VIRU|nr:MAG: hypothetical protein LCMAC101_03710 [Marseillevirus LCMAC101]